MKKILIIDDAEPMVLLMVQELQRSGFDTLVAANGAIGIELAKQHHPDLIICDVNMPFVDGVETFAAVESEPATAGIPFIFTSGFAWPPSQKGKAMPATLFLEKPFTRSQLLNLVNTVLDGSSSNSPASEQVGVHAD